jgi:hypothetical protein
MSEQLHAAIMNLPCDPPGFSTNWDVYDGYRRGHRDARHAAAELAAEATAALRTSHAALVAAIEEGRRAIGDHNVPDDCYATGPMTGDPIRDLVQCPACSFLAMSAAALAEAQKVQQ